MIKIKGQHYSGYFPKSKSLTPTQSQFCRKTHYRNRSIFSLKQTAKKQTTQISDFHELQPMIKIYSLSQYSVLKKQDKKVNSFGQGRVHVKNNITTYKQQIKPLTFDSLRNILLNSNNRNNFKSNNILLPKKQKKNQRLMKCFINNYFKRRINIRQNKNLEQQIQKIQSIRNNQQPIQIEKQKIQRISPTIRYGKQQQVKNNQIKLQNKQSQEIIKSLSGWKILVDRSFLSSKVKKSIRLSNSNSIIS